MSKFCSAGDAVKLVKDGQTVASVGVIGWITPDTMLKALADRFRTTGAPKDLTFYFPCGTGDGINIRGMDHVAIVGLMKRIMCGLLRQSSQSGDGQASRTHAPHPRKRHRGV
jgi:propionate CoA-transferase